MEQNYENHVRYYKPFHLYFTVVLFLTLLGSFVNFYQSLGDHHRMYSASLLVVLCFLLFQLGFFARSFSIKVQDRVIRAEENFRYHLLTGKLLPADLTPKQIAALRFASDSEFAELVSRASAEKMLPTEIKRTIKTWRPDTFRV